MDTAALLVERGKTHGDYTDHATITQALKFCAKDGKNWHSNPPVVKEALEMIFHKIGRILSGDPDFRDHWDDIAGYAKLVADRCSK